jgi:GNAT superfamily N-acetyltransferase
MQISIADRTCNAAELADFFHKNLTSDYISHSELQGYRAIDPGKWSPDIRSVLENEIMERLEVPLKEFPRERDWRGVVAGRDRGSLVALSLVTTSFSCRVPHAIVEDIVVDASDRGRSRGTYFMKWLIARAMDAGINRIFLESGLGNDRAHSFFEHLGFHQVSVVMMADTQTGS